MALTNNQAVLSWIDEMAKMTQPDQIVWIDGSQEQIDALRAEACSTGEMEKLNQELLPDCYLHRTAVNDVARVEDRTFICCEKQEDAGPTNNWMDPQEMHEKLNKLYTGAMKGRTMYVIPYSMGVVGSPFAKYGIELTDSIYVVLNMCIMTRVGARRGRPARMTTLSRASTPRPTSTRRTATSSSSPRRTPSCPSTPATAATCCWARSASPCASPPTWASKQGWMAEHMLILGMENPQGEVRYLAAAFPSACGKTNLAMLIPPAAYREKGWKVWCVGDDIAWIRIGEDGRLWAMNPEYGFFGVAPGTNEKSNPNALATTRQGTIFTNVAHNLDNNTVWWEGLDKNPPEHAVDWKGNPWNGKTSTEKGAHPNSRFTAPAKNCPCISPEFENPKGVPLSAIVFGGRRAKTAPLVYQARDWAHGVFVGSIMASETTAAAAGAVGVVRRDPMAMLPFCGYHMADYWQHWLDMGKKVDADKLPKIFNVNWFRTDDEGHFIWPGFGDNLRVLEWIMKRAFSETDAVETAIGYQPKAEDINLEGLDISKETVEGLLGVDKDLWREEAKGIHEFYNKFDGKVPQELLNELAKLEENLK